MNAFKLTHQALMSNVIDDKIKLTQQLQLLSINQKLSYEATQKIQKIPNPGRPKKPELVRFQHQ
jgi:uncharacterized ferritin-like protein (DUF455 family)